MAYASCLNPMAIPFHPEKIPLPSSPFKLNPEAIEFDMPPNQDIGFKLNPKAKEFISCGAVCGDYQCSEQEAEKMPDLPSTSNRHSLTNSEDSATGDESGLESEDSDDSEGERIVLIGSRPNGFDLGEAITTPSKLDSGSSLDCGIVVSELNPDAETFLPQYWIPVSDNERPESSDGPQQLEAEETNLGSQEQLNSSWEPSPNSTENDVNGVILSKYLIVSPSVEDEDRDLPSYDLVYGLVGFVYVPN